MKAHELVEKYLSKGKDIPIQDFTDCMLTEFPGSTFAVNWENLGKKYGWTDEETIENAYDVFRYEVLKWCGCGDTKTSDEIVRKYLLATSKSFDERSNLLEKYFGVRSPYDNPLLLCLAYTIDAAELTEHGTSVGSAWASDKGRIYLWILGKRKAYEEEYRIKEETK